MFAVSAFEMFGLKKTADVAVIEAVKQKDLATAKTKEAEEKTAEAQKNLDLEARTASLFREAQSKTALDDGHPVLAMLIALDGLRDEHSDDAFQRTRPFMPQTWHALHSAFQE